MEITIKAIQIGLVTIDTVSYTHLDVYKRQRYNEFGDRPYYDESRNIRKGNFIFHPVLTLKNGEIVYRDITF